MPPSTVAETRKTNARIFLSVRVECVECVWTLCRQKALCLYSILIKLTGYLFLQIRQGGAVARRKIRQKFGVCVHAGSGSGSVIFIPGQAGAAVRGTRPNGADLLVGRGADKLGVVVAHVHAGSGYAIFIPGRAATAVRGTRGAALLVGRGADSLGVGVAHVNLAARLGAVAKVGTVARIGGARARAVLDGTARACCARRRASLLCHAGALAVLVVESGLAATARDGDYDKTTPHVCHRVLPRGAVLLVVSSALGFPGSVAVVVNASTVGCEEGFVRKRARACRTVGIPCRVRATQADIFM